MNRIKEIWPNAHPNTSVIRRRENGKKTFKAKKEEEKKADLFPGMSTVPNSKKVYKVS